MRTLSPSERRALQAKAHALHPVVVIGQHGLTPAVLKEIDSSLRAHELIKIRVFNDQRVARQEALARICAELDAVPVQHLGKLLIVWRPAAVTDPTPGKASANNPFTTKRPRQRTRAKPATTGGGTAATTATPGGRHRPRVGTAAPRSSAARRKPQPSLAEGSANGTSNRRRRRVS